MLLGPNEPARVNSSFVGAASSGRAGSYAYFVAESNDYSALSTRTARQYLPPAPPL